MKIFPEKISEASASDINLLLKNPSGIGDPHVVLSLSETLVEISTGSQNFSTIQFDLIL